MKKRLLSMTLAGVMAAGMLAGCGSSGSTDTKGSAASSGSGDYYLDFVFKTTSNEYTQYLMAGVKAAAKDLGVQADMKGATSETSYDEQQNMIETDLNSGKYDALITAPLQGDTVATLIQDVDTPVFAIDGDFQSDKKISFIGISQFNAAESGGEAAVEAAKKAGWKELNAICIAGVRGDEAAEDRKNGYKEGVEANGGTFLDDEVQYADSVADKAVNSMEAIMQNHPEGIAMILCHNDDCAMAAARAAKNNEAYKDTIFVGIDGNISACESILNGEETMTVASDTYGTGYNAVVTAVDYLNGKDVDSFVESDVQIVTKDNAQEHMDKLKKQLASLDKSEIGSAAE